MTVRGQKNWLLGSISRMRSGIQVVEMCSFVLKWSPLDQEASWRPPFGGFKGHVQIRGLVLDWLHWPSNATGFLRKSWETWRSGFQGCLVYRATIMCHVFCLENSLSILEDSQEAESITPYYTIALFKYCLPFKPSFYWQISFSCMQPATFSVYVFIEINQWKNTFYLVHTLYVQLQPEMI